MVANRTGSPIDRLPRLVAEYRRGICASFRDGRPVAEGVDRVDGIDPGFDPVSLLRENLEKRRRGIRFFVVLNLLGRRNQAGELPPIKVRTPKLRAYFCLTLVWLKIQSQDQVEALRRKIALAREAARDRCRSAIDRTIDREWIDALVKQVTALVADALDHIENEPLPRVLAAGGRTGLHVPLN